MSLASMQQMRDDGARGGGGVTRGAWSTPPRHPRTLASMANFAISRLQILVAIAYARRPSRPPPAAHKPEGRPALTTSAEHTATSAPTTGTTFVGLQPPKPPLPTGRTAAERRRAADAAAPADEAGPDTCPPSPNSARGVGGGVAQGCRG
ncbi:hypothetical protein OAO87_01040 [bacterium]|nr:hypothetical protein [bacterium]